MTITINTSTWTNNLKNLWIKIKAAFSGVVEWTKDKITALKTHIMGAWAALTSIERAQLRDKIKNAFGVDITA